MAAEMAKLSKHPHRERTEISKLENEQLEQETGDLLCLAQKNGFTKQGEMFSAENLAELSTMSYGLHTLVAENGFEDHRLVLSHLAKRSPVLVPYDAAKNHEPCMAQGHRAHWAVLTGW